MKAPYFKLNLKSGGRCMQFHNPLSCVLYLIKGFIEIHNSFLIPSLSCTYKNNGNKGNGNLTQKLFSCSDPPDGRCVCPGEIKELKDGGKGTVT